VTPLKYVAGFCFGVWVGLAGFSYDTWQYWVLVTIFALVVSL
jgi:hypothetical protein